MGMSSIAPCCAVTGASGYVGSMLSRSLLSRGAQVIELNRSGQSRQPGARGAAYSLGSVPAADSFAGVDALIHCAYDFVAHSRVEVWRSNVEGTLRLFAAAHDAGVRRIIFISTLSAYEGCRSLYGQAKLAVEREGRPYGVVSVRPGLIFDNDRPQGMVGALSRFIDLSPVVPLIGGGKQVLYPCHADDLGRLIAVLTVAPDPVISPIPAASKAGLTFREILRRIALSKHRRVVFVPAPYHPLYWGLRLAEMGGMRTRLRSDSLLSLMSQNPHVDFAPLDALGVPFRGYPEPAEA